MRLRGFCVTGTALFIAATTCVARAGADTIVIHSGTLEIRGLGTSVPKPVSLSGEPRGFALQAIAAEGPFGLRLCPDLCRAGQTVSAEAMYVGLDLRGTVTLDGTTHRIGSLESASALLQFRSSMVLPAAVDASAVVTAPFLFDGLFTAFGGQPLDLVAAAGSARPSCRPCFSASSAGCPSTRSTSSTARWRPFRSRGRWRCSRPQAPWR